MGRTAELASVVILHVLAIGAIVGLTIPFYEQNVLPMEEGLARTLAGTAVLGGAAFMVWQSSLLIRGVMWGNRRWPPKARG